MSSLQSLKLFLSSFIWQRWTKRHAECYTHTLFVLYSLSHKHFITCTFAKHGNFKTLVLMPSLQSLKLFLSPTHYLYFTHFLINNLLPSLLPNMAIFEHIVHFVFCFSVQAFVFPHRYYKTLILNIISRSLIIKDVPNNPPYWNSSL